MKAERAKAPKAMKPWKGWALVVKDCVPEMFVTRWAARYFRDANVGWSSARVVRVEVREVSRG